MRGAPPATWDTHGRPGKLPRAAASEPPRAPWGLGLPRWRGSPSPGLRTAAPAWRRVPAAPALRRLRDGARSGCAPLAADPGAPRPPPSTFGAGGSVTLPGSLVACALARCFFLFFNQFPKKMVCVEGVKIEFIYDKSKLWPKKPQKTKTPEEATGFWRVPGAALDVSARPAGCPCPPGPRRPLLHHPFSEAGKPTTPSEGLHGATWKLCT